MTNAAEEYTRTIAADAKSLQLKLSQLGEALTNKQRIEFSDVEALSSQFNNLIAKVARTVPVAW
ncbi:hypothetical protein HJB82_31005 [Rhizobium sp. NZLR10]|uniref:hypothetical protein n=1 Tax=Rhizobium sp. NZLR10 TaxID=2731097 RepID=UPI001C839415|nr:hypothetical protein [Rhizobium sp. NZLR10]MBX5199691.1 hypothetical protein [Rhizobium sp. NZLR10]